MVKLFLSGDVMTGRGVDQILGHPGDPGLWEPYIRDARRYVKLAEAVSGQIPRPAGDAWIWGDALRELHRSALDARIINLETSVTVSDRPQRGKGVHYRMHPGNVGCLTAAAIDVCVLANNHVLDFGYEGLAETLQTLRRAGVQTAGAGSDLDEARRPAIINLPAGGRVVVVSVAARSCGVPEDWAGASERPGVDVVADLSASTAAEVAARIGIERRPGDIAVVSIHWGSNWGYEVSPDQVRFAHLLVEAGVNVVHGHSSHHPRPIEVYEGRLILYGCGDFINDYEGVGGHEAFRGDLALMYLLSLAPAGGELARLRMIPMQMRQMRLGRASPADALWLWGMLNEVSRPYGTRIAVEPDGELIEGVWHGG
jgi:poly-gamma-glutamate capsule biosynthesis protein CapA/YwtB (metallophosphatase superfamily)